MIALRGTTPAISTELLGSSIFVLPSEFEGFGIVILEAKNAALPCIGYADCNGPNDLIHPGIDGLLIDPDEDGASLATALTRLAADELLRKRMGDAAREDIKRFDIPLITEQWERMLLQVVYGGGRAKESTQPDPTPAKPSKSSRTASKLGGDKIMALAAGHET